MSPALRDTRQRDDDAHTAHRRQRSGFSLAELIVALMLLTVGLLALASTSAFLTYEYAASGRAEQAAVLAGSRLELLQVGDCTASQGIQTVDGLTAVWSVVPAGHGARATVGVSWMERGRPIVHHFDSGFSC